MALRGGTNPGENVGDRLLSLVEVAQRLGVSKRTVYRMMAGEELPQPVKVRSLSRIPESAVRACIERITRERH